jgi:Cd2+/Zn2+-exporting ATPase
METVKKEFFLDGLDCANCAAKIEKKIGEIAGIDSATVNFVTKTLTFQIGNQSTADALSSQVKTAIKAIEPHVAIREKKVQKSDHGGKDHSLDHDYGGGINNKAELIRLIISAILFGTAVLFQFSVKTEFILYIMSYALVGAEVLLRAVRNLIRGQVFDENFLMAIATIGAFSIRQFPEGVAVMLFYQIGELFQDIAVNRSRRSIAELMDIRPDYANLIIGSDVKRVSPEEVSVGDLILVKPGEKFPLDGKVTDGRSMVDTSALTGESMPREVEPGSSVLSGSINQNGLVTVEVIKDFGESTVAKILDLVENASSKKAPTENFITKFARYYTPTVVMIAAALAVIPPIVIPEAVFSDWLYRALVFLVISCPCALVISIPLGFFGGIGGASKRGILIKGSNYLEALNHVDMIVFDKTGTLTKGVFKVTEINPHNGFTPQALLEYAAYAESHSTHPIAVSIAKEYGKEIGRDAVENYEEIPGHGIKVTVNHHEVHAGNLRLMTKENITFDQVDPAGTAVYVAVDGKYAGYLLISDEVKEDAKAAISGLKQLGIRKTVMLTGDNRMIAGKVAAQLGLDEHYAELLPNQKVEELEILDKQKSKGGKLLFVGDGINDAPVLARADIGIAMGGLGSDAAIEAADVVIMTDEPSKIVSAIRIAKKTRRVVWQNIFFTMAVKLFVLALGAGGLATIWEAVFADVGVALIAVLNAMRVLNVKDVD